MFLMGQVENSAGHARWRGMCNPVSSLSAEGTACGVTPLGTVSVPSDLDLVPAWLTVPDLAQRFGERITTIRRWLDERDLIAVRRGDRSVLSVPAAFVDEHGPLAALKGTFTVLADGGMSDAEIIGWLFAPDDTLPVPGAAIDALRAGFKTEVRRRAMETAL